MDWQTLSALKRFVERTIDKNFQWLPEPKRKRVKHAADKDESGRHKTQKDDNNVGKQMSMVNIANIDETETDYDDYSDLDPILPLEGLPRPVTNDNMVKIPGLEDLD